MAPTVQAPVSTPPAQTSGQLDLTRLYAVTGKTPPQQASTKTPAAATTVSVAKTPRQVDTTGTAVERTTAKPLPTVEALASEGIIRPTYNLNVGPLKVYSGHDEFDVAAYNKKYNTDATYGDIAKITGVYGQGKIAELNLLTEKGVDFNKQSVVQYGLSTRVIIPSVTQNQSTQSK